MGGGGGGGGLGHGGRRGSESDAGELIKISAYLLRRNHSAAIARHMGRHQGTHSNINPFKAAVVVVPGYIVSTDLFIPRE